MNRMYPTDWISLRGDTNMSNDKISGRENQQSGNDNQATDQIKSRRRLIQAIAAGGIVSSSAVAPTKWSSPVVKSVIVPAHGATTGAETCMLGNSTGTALNLDPGKFYEREAQLASGQSITPSGVDEMLLGVALAQDGENECDKLTGCFWIEFECNSDVGTLYATAFDDSADGAQTLVLAAPFEFEELGVIGGVCFEVTQENGASAAVLELFCNCDGKPIFTYKLLENFDCEPLGQDN